MITLTSEEFAAIEAGFQGRRRRTLLARLREDGTIPAAMSDADAMALIDAIIADGKALEITDDADIAGLVQIAVLPEDVRRHPVIGPSLMAVLLDLEQAAGDRLDFIRHRILDSDTRLDRKG